MQITERERIALKQTLDFLKSQEGESHAGYYYSGWAGAELRRLLTRTAKLDRLDYGYGEEHYLPIEGIKYE